MRLQIFFDRVIAKTILPFIPHSVSPNQVSWARIIALPFIYFLIVYGYMTAGLVVFALAALTDALDGAMARTRNQVTESGKILDAVADRGLIALVAVIFIPQYFGWTLLVLLALAEIGNAGAAYRSKKKIGKNPGANWAGKVKMCLQCLAFGMVFLALALTPDPWLMLSGFVLWLSLPFALLQSFLYP